MVASDSRYSTSWKNQVVTHSHSRIYPYSLTFFCTCLKELSHGFTNFPPRAPAVALSSGEGADKTWYKLAKMFTLSLRATGDPALVSV